MSVTSLRKISKGRGNALLVTILLVMVLISNSGFADAASYTVGGGSGWTFDVESWPRGKRFMAGDTLVFNYNRAFHTVVAVNKRGYDSCNAPASAKVYSSGRDQIRLARGQTYFICTFRGHCQSGMKIAINAI